MDICVSLDTLVECLSKSHYQFASSLFNLKFPGAHSIADAYEAKVAQTGVTVHFVDEGVDTGPIIRQERVAIDPSWDLGTLESHVHAMEYDLFWQVIEQVAKSIEEEKE